MINKHTDTPTCAPADTPTSTPADASTNTPTDVPTDVCENSTECASNPFLLWAKRELDMLLEGIDDGADNDGDVDYMQKKVNKNIVDGDYDRMQKRVNKDIMDILTVFAEQGHSGFSAGYVINMLQRLLNWIPIKPLTGEDDEWEEAYEDVEQNTRCPGVFRHGKDNSTATYNGRVFSDDGGRTWFTNRDSHVPITFPFYVPTEPEYVILENTPEGGDKDADTL